MERELASRGVQRIAPHHYVASLGKFNRMTSVVSVNFASLIDICKFLAISL
jgi:hypothetical protein